MTSIIYPIFYDSISTTILDGRDRRVPSFPCSLTSLLPVTLNNNCSHPGNQLCYSRSDMKPASFLILSTEYLFHPHDTCYHHLLLLVVLPGLVSNKPAHCG